MRKIYFKKLVIVFSLGIIIFLGIVCKSSNYFHKQSIEEKHNSITTPFFYLLEQTYYDIDFGTNYTSRYNDQLVEDWDKFLSGKMPKHRLSYFLLDTNSYPEILKAHTA